MKIRFPSLEGFEKRFIKATAAAGGTELLLGLSPLAPIIGHHLQTFGYLGVGMILLAGYHELFRRIERRDNGQIHKQS